MVVTMTELNNNGVFCKGCNNTGGKKYALKCGVKY